MPLNENLSEDQLRVLEVLSTNFINKSSEFLVGKDNGFLGMPYKNIMKDANLSLEKTLLSLGALEAKGIVKHDCAVQRQIIDYLGQSNVEISGQEIVRMFTLTEKGQNALEYPDKYID